MDDFEIEDYTELEMHQPSKSNGRKAAKFRKASFNLAEKMKLAEVIREYPAIWDRNHPRHFNAIFLRDCWSEISKILKRKVEDCRTAWKSIRDSRRYRIRKSGRSCCDPDEAEEWELNDALSFLPDPNRRKKITSADEKNSEEEAESTSNHRSKSSRHSRNEPDLDFFRSAIEQITDACTKLGSTSPVSAAIAPKEASIYEPFLSIFRLKLKQLPERTAENLCFQFISMINSEIDNDQ